MDGALSELTHRGGEATGERFGVERLHEVAQMAHRKTPTDAFLLLRLRRQLAVARLDALLLHG